jgi:hypothetical protein
MPHAAMMVATALAHGVRLGELVAADIAVMIGVEPVEHSSSHLGAALLAPRPRFLRSEAAVMIGIHPGERLVDSVDDLLAGDVGIGAGSVPRLRGCDAGDGQQGGAGQERDLCHWRILLRKKGDGAALQAWCRANLSAPNNLVPNCRRFLRRSACGAR